MTAATSAPAVGAAVRGPRLLAHAAAAAWLAPVTLFVFALGVRLVATLIVRFPLTEGSAYYVAVAQNVATGRGLVVDSIWSYATPPLTLPRPAFELWQPLASLVAAAPMGVLGASFASAQVAFALLGATLAPLVWLVARDAARRLEVPAGRAGLAAVGAGLLAAVAGPFVLSAALPDSTMPFTVLAVAACLVLPAAVDGERRALVALGVLAGLAYLTRMEAVYLVVAFVGLGWALRVGWRALIGRGLAVAVVGALVALPWWLRNLAVFGTPLPGQVTDNALLTRNEQIFAYEGPTTLEGFLGQGAAVIIGNIVEAFRHDIVDVLVVPGTVLVVVGVLALALGRRHGHALRGAPLTALLLLGVTTLLVTSVAFPVATLWGTFEHAAGPLLVALAVAAALGADALVARVRAWRGWPRTNAWLGPAALIALTVPLTLVQVTGAGAQARGEQERFAALAAELRVALAESGIDPAAPIISDRPIWLSDALGQSVIALPDEPVPAVLALAADFGARAIVVVEQRGRHPAALAEAQKCVTEVGHTSGLQDARFFVIAEDCQ